MKRQKERKADEWKEIKMKVAIRKEENDRTN
jgi:hypothetical protein